MYVVHCTTYTTQYNVRRTYRCTKYTVRRTLRSTMYDVYIGLRSTLRSTVYVVHIGVRRILHPSSHRTILLQSLAISSSLSDYEVRWSHQYVYKCQGVTLHTVLRTNINTVLYCTLYGYKIYSVQCTVYYITITQ